MRSSRLLIAALALVIVGAGCDVAQIIPSGTAPLRYRDQIFGTVAKSTDITYGSAVNLSNQTVTLKLDMYQPPATDTVTSRPAIVWVHGGSFSGGDKTSPEIVDESNNFAKEGFVNVSINYRLEPGGCSAAAPTSSCLAAIQEATADAQTAVRFLRTNATTYGVDPNRIAIGGSSAGAITALQVGYASSENPASKVRAALSLSGANLLSAISAGDAAALLFHGTADPLVPYQWAVNTVNAATAAGLTVSLETFPGAGHVPYQFRTQILAQSRNFLYWTMDLRHAAQ
jgi:para-nitrobenzyl esterase